MSHVINYQDQMMIDINIENRELKQRIAVLQAELALTSTDEKLVARVQKLETAIKTALFGTPLDSCGNLDTNGLYGFYNVNQVVDQLHAAVPGSSRTSFGKEIAEQSRDHEL